MPLHEKTVAAGAVSECSNDLVVGLSGSFFSWRKLALLHVCVAGLGSTHQQGRLTVVLQQCALLWPMHGAAVTGCPDFSSFAVY